MVKRSIRIVRPSEIEHAKLLSKRLLTRVNDNQDGHVSKDLGSSVGAQGNLHARAGVSLLYFD